MRFIIVFMAIFVTFSLAIEDYPASYNGSGLQNTKYNVDKFQININDMSVKKVLNRMKRYKALMNDSYDLRLLLKPLIKPLKAIDVVYGHPNFITTLIFPNSFVIQSAETKVPMENFSFSQNMLKFSPKKGADIGNIVITVYDLKDHRNKVFNYIYKTYSYKNLKYDEQYGIYATADGEFFSFTVKYVEGIDLNPIQVLEKYVEVYGLKRFNRTFRHNGDYDAILINKVPVYIIRDETQGTIHYFNKKFKVLVGDLND